MQFENHTPHAIALKRVDGSLQLLAPVEPAIRLLTEPGAPEPDLVGGMPIYGAVQLRGVIGLPPPRPDVLLVVSQLAALAISSLHPERMDCVHPATMPSRAPRRDRDGVASVSGLVRA